MLLAVDFDHAVEGTGRVIEALGVGIMVLGIALAFVGSLRRRIGGGKDVHDYHEVRQGIGRSILLGLEVLIAGDIIRTVAISPTFTSIGVLGGIVVIRSFLSMTLEMEVEGRWPWQRSRRDHDPARDGAV